MSAGADRRATQSQRFALTPENLDRAKAIVARYPEGREGSAVLPLLDLAQRQNGGTLTRSALEYVADLVGVPAIQVWEAATFYTMCNLHPVGKHHVHVCTNISCWLRGSDAVMATCREALGIDVGETSRDGLFTLAEVECLGACVNAPMMMINDDYYEDLDARSTEHVLNVLKAGGTPRPGPQNGRKGCEPIGGPTTLTGRGGKPSAAGRKERG